MARMPASVAWRNVHCCGEGLAVAVVLSSSPSLVSDLFDLNVSVLEKVLRALLVFGFLVIALRLGGKRELGQINVLDLAVLLLVSNVLQNAMIGNDNSLTGGAIGAATLFGANYLFVRLTFRSARVRRLLEGRPRVLLDHGQTRRDALKREAITQSELRSAAREHGFAELGDVELIVLETNGHLAVMGADVAAQWWRDNEREFGDDQRHRRG